MIFWSRSLPACPTDCYTRRPFRTVDKPHLSLKINSQENGLQIVVTNGLYPSIEQTKWLLFLEWFYVKHLTSLFSLVVLHLFKVLQCLFVCLNITDARLVPSAQS